MKKLLLWLINSLCFLYFILLIPDKEEKAPQVNAKKTFSWNRDMLWKNLELE